MVTEEGMLEERRAGLGRGDGTNDQAGLRLGAGPSRRGPERVRHPLTGSEEQRPVARARSTEENEH
jgi:hypothetical protein